MALIRRNTVSFHIILYNAETLPVNWAYHICLWTYMQDNFITNEHYVLYFLYFFNFYRFIFIDNFDPIFCLHILALMIYTFLLTHLMPLISFNTSWKRSIPEVFWCFQEVLKETSGMKWVKLFTNSACSSLTFYIYFWTAFLRWVSITFSRNKILNMYMKFPDYQNPPIKYYPQH